MIIQERSAGILLHITSLPSKFGIGDLGPEAYKFADLLQEAGQRYWQILPLNPTETGMGNSPYSSHSAFAGNPLLISPELLVKEGLLQRKDLELQEQFTPGLVNYEKVIAWRTGIWDKAFLNFQKKDRRELRSDFDKFRKQHDEWLRDFSFFVAFKEHFGGKSWTEWEEGIRKRKKQAIQKLAHQLADKIEREQFLQFLFYRQWENLVVYCREKGITFIGDMPFYVSHDSADVWANPQNFKLASDGKPTAVSGVPPDFFSKTGQLWGTPVFNWTAQKKDNYSWWLRRVHHNLQLFGLLRLDHFRAFSAYWEVPAGDDTAKNGRWVKSPGAEILSLIKKQHPDMPIIAEDLGEIDQPVRDLQQQFDLPGMRLLLYAFGDDLAFDSSFLPHNHVQNCLVYTGTHDNATARAWYQSANPADRQRLKQYTNQPVTKENAHHIFARLAYQSVAQLAVLPMQDVLGLGEEAIMNRPSTPSGNWEWRLKPGAFSKKTAQGLRALAHTYGRA